MSRSRKSQTRLPLSRDLVIDTALALADEKGIEALSMRRLGEVLGVKAMSLYNHVADKEAVLDGLVDRVYAEITVPSPNAPWVAEMREFAVSKRTALKRHPWAPGQLGRCRNPGPENRRLLDAVLACLLAAGLTAFEAVHAYSAINSYVHGFASLQANVPFTNAAEHKEALEVAMRSLSETEYPHSTKVGLELMRTGYEYDDEFEWGLDALLEGLKAVLHNRQDG